MRWHIAHFFIINRLGKGLEMETILDFTSVFLLKILLPYSKVLATKADQASAWKFGMYQTTDSGILHITFPHTDKELYHFQAFCPEEWNVWKCLDSPQYDTPRRILSNASATTYPQITRMKIFNVDRPLPAFIDLSQEGVNVVITTFLGPSQKVLNEIQKKLVKELDEKL